MKCHVQHFLPLRTFSFISFRSFPFCTFNAPLHTFTGWFWFSQANSFSKTFQVQMHFWIRIIWILVFHSDAEAEWSRLQPSKILSFTKTEISRSKNLEKIKEKFSNKTSKFSASFIRLLLLAGFFQSDFRFERENKIAIRIRSVRIGSDRNNNLQATLLEFSSLPSYKFQLF